jgi:DnaJ-class molecular chaperone
MKICPRCKGNGYIKVKKEVTWPSKEQEIVVQCTMCNSEGEIKDEGDPGPIGSDIKN